MSVTSQRTAFYVSKYIFFYGDAEHSAQRKIG